MIRPRTSWKSALAHEAPHGLRRILVALDGSPEGETILDHLKQQVSNRTVLLLVHVIPIPPPSSTPQIRESLQLEEDTEGYLEKVQERLPGFRSRWIVETGDAAEGILSTARAEHADALAMTSHARGRLASLFLGSVAREVVTRAGRPVFLVRPDVPPPRPPRRRILVPVAEPAGAEAVRPVVEALAHQRDSEVHLLHVLPFPRMADPVIGFNPIVLRPLQLPDAAWLDSFADHLSHHGVRVVRSMPAGEPDEVVLYESRAQDVDLIVLGPHPSNRRILSSVSEKVLQKADRAVLLTPRVEG